MEAAGVAVVDKADSRGLTKQKLLLYQLLKEAYQVQVPYGICEGNEWNTNGIRKSACRTA